MYRSGILVDQILVARKKNNVNFVVASFASICGDRTDGWVLGMCHDLLKLLPETGCALKTFSNRSDRFDVPIELIKIREASREILRSFRSERRLEEED